VSQVFFLSSDERLPELLQAASATPVRVTDALARTLGRSPGEPAALVLDLRPHHHLPPWVRQIRQKQPKLAIVVVVSSPTPRFVADAMEAGIEECLPEPLTPEALREALDRLRAGMTDGHKRQMVACIGAKGGVGATMIAVNAAAALAFDGPPPLLVDLHVARGDAAFQLGALPRFSILDAFERLHTMDDSLLAGLTEATPSGVHVLASSTRPVNVAMSPSALRALLDLAARRYSRVVLDVPRTDPAMLESLDSATSIVVVATPEIGVARGAATMVAMLRQRYGSARLRIVMNRAGKNGALTPREFETIVGEPVTCLVPDDYRAAVEAINVGRPAVLDDSRFARELRAALATLLPSAVAGAAAPRDRLTWRRA
jgi:pilus assembly protein CpaE